MEENETTKNTLQQLRNIINQGNWKDIEQLEDGDGRYSIALDKALLLIKELEELKEKENQRIHTWLNDNYNDAIDDLAEILIGFFGGFTDEIYTQVPVKHFVCNNIKIFSDKLKSGKLD